MMMSKQLIIVHILRVKKPRLRMVNYLIQGQSRWGQIRAPVSQSLLQGCARCARNLSNSLPNRKNQRCTQRSPRLKTFFHDATSFSEKNERAWLRLEKCIWGSVACSAGREEPPLLRSPRPARRTAPARAWARRGRGGSARAGGGNAEGAAARGADRAGGGAGRECAGRAGDRCGGGLAGPGATAAAAA